MHTLDFFRVYVSAEKNVNQSILVEDKLATETHNDIKPIVGDIPFGVLLLAPICFMIAWAIVILIVLKLCQLVGDKNEIISIKNSQQHRCENCRFFNKNYYLKCAVHPSIALTKQALHCSDYSKLVLDQPKSLESG
jgi:hypothetical protein